MSKHHFLLKGIRFFQDSAVMILLDSHQRILFTKRSRLVKTHKGQYSFPGGKKEAGDKNLEQTALRETFEEIGIPSHNITSIKALKPAYSPLGFIIHPFVGKISDHQNFILQTDEVERIIRVPIRFFYQTTPISRIFKRGGRSIKVDFYQFGPHVIWGATARILSLLKKFLQKT